MRALHLFLHLETLDETFNVPSVASYLMEKLLGVLIRKEAIQIILFAGKKSIEIDFNRFLLLLRFDFIRIFSFFHTFSYRTALIFCQLCSSHNLGGYASGLGFLAELELEKSIIEALFRHQFMVIAHFSHAAFVKHDNSIHVANRR